MEVRVWTDGIERVVCGVTDVTTCRDVIIALARTVGKTGCYSLIERYQGYQRQLPPSERLQSRLSELAGSVRQLTLVHSSQQSDQSRDVKRERRRRVNGSVDRHWGASASFPFTKSRSVGCFRSLIANEEMRTHRVPDYMSLPKSLDDNKVRNSSESNTSWQRLHNGYHNTTKQSATGFDGQSRRRLSAGSLSSVSSGEFEPLAQAVSRRSPVTSIDNSTANGVSRSLSRSDLESKSREELLSLLSRQQSEISLREAELQRLNADSLEPSQNNEQSLSARLSELEQLERTVDEELEELELVSWHDKLVMETSRCVQLQADTGALKSSISRSQREADEWQQRLGESTTETEAVKAYSQQMESDKTRLKEQLENLELKLAESRRISHDRQSALQQVEKTLENNAELVRVRLEEQLRLQRELDTRTTAKSQFQRSSSFDRDSRARSKQALTKKTWSFV